jgi:hypothetical protein
MSDNILTAVLTFSLLAGGTAAIGTEMLGSRHEAALASTPVFVMPEVTITARRAAAPEIVTLPQVTITAQRATRPADVVTLPQVTITAQRAARPADVVTLPMVVVTGKREALTVAVETRASEAPRIE